MALGITVDINANLARFEEQMNRLGGNLDRFQNRAEDMSAGVNKALGALGVGLSIAGITAFIKSGIDAADALNDMSDRTGIAIEKLAGLQFATKLGDTNMEAFSASSNKLSINIAKNSEEFAKLGITAKDPAEAFLQFADVFSKIDDPQRRAALGAAAMGKSYSEMAPMLQMGSEKLRQLIADGQQMSGITAESAAQAGAFNDQLDILAARTEGLRTKIALGILEPLVSMAQEMSLSIEKTGQLEGALGNLGEEYKNLAADASVAMGAMAGLRFGPLGAVAGAAIGWSVGKSLTKSVDDQINVLQRKLNVMSNQGFLGQLIDDATGQDINLVKNQLDALIKTKQDLAKPIQSLLQADTPGLVNNKAIDDLLKLSGDSEKAAKKAESASQQAAKAEASRAEGIGQLINNLQFEISLSGMSADQQQRLTAIHSATAKATDTEAASIAKLINSKYDLAEADAILAEGEQLAKKQRDDMAADYDRLNQKFNGPLIDLNAGIADAMDARAAGIIPDDEKLKVVLDKMGHEYNKLTSDAETATGQMSEFAVQAARNMQSSFADFLFDPFQDGIEGMGSNFLKIIQRMAAEAASAQIFESLLGKNYGADNATGGLLSGLFSVAASAVGSYFGGGGSVSVADGNSEAFTSMMSGSNWMNVGVHHDGGVAGSSSRRMSVDPSAFANAPRFHSGGVVGLQPDEVPAILQRGEVVLSRKQLASSPSTGGDISITTQVTVTSNGDSSSSAGDMGKKLGAMINAGVRQVIVTEKRPGGLLA
jgi:hypothetical protein